MVDDDGDIGEEDEEEANDDKLGDEDDEDDDNGENSYSDASWGGLIECFRVRVCVCAFE